MVLAFAGDSTMTKFFDMECFIYGVAKKGMEFGCLQRTS